MIKTEKLKNSDRKELITYCDFCHRPIYSGDDYVKTGNGHYACTDLCFRFLKAMEHKKMDEENEE